MTSSSAPLFTPERLPYCHELSAPLVYALRELRCRPKTTTEAAASAAAVAR